MRWVTAIKVGFRTSFIPVFVSLNLFLDIEHAVVIVGASTLKSFKIYGFILFVKFVDRTLNVIP